MIKFQCVVGLLLSGVVFANEDRVLIIGGHETNEYPYIRQIQSMTANKKPHSCTAVQTGPNTLITAAHCVTFTGSIINQNQTQVELEVIDPATIEVTSQFNQAKYGPVTIKHKANAVFTNNFWQKADYYLSHQYHHLDMAIIYLKNSAPISEYAKISSRPARPGDRVAFVGFGMTRDKVEGDEFGVPTSEIAKRVGFNTLTSNTSVNSNLFGPEYAQIPQESRTSMLWALGDLEPSILTKWLGMLSFGNLGKSSVSFGDSGGAWIVDGKVVGISAAVFDVRNEVMSNVPTDQRRLNSAASIHDPINWEMLQVAVKQGFEIEFK